VLSLLHVSNRTNKQHDLSAALIASMGGVGHTVTLPHCHSLLPHVVITPSPPSIDTEWGHDISLNTHQHSLLSKLYTLLHRSHWSSCSSCNKGMAVVWITMYIAVIRCTDCTAEYQIDFSFIFLKLRPLSTIRVSIVVSIPACHQCVP
jgi:hypothetical protein